jgi:heme oxygenase
MNPGELADRLRLGTRELHKAAERTRFMQSMLRGQIGQAAYCRLLCSLHTIYEPLENALARHATFRPLNLLHLPGLPRSAGLAADLDTLYGGDWRRNLEPAAAARAYALHLRQIDATDPLLLVAHSYVRYLGDLSGGQILQEIIARALSLTGDDGTRFYRFAAPGATAMAAAYRHGLAQIQVDAATLARLVAEAGDAFGRHCKLFEELAPADASS